MDRVIPGVKYEDYLHFRQCLTIALMTVDLALLLYVLHLLGP